MARKSKMTGYALCAGLVAVGVYFADEITEQFNKLKAQFGGK